MSEIKVSEMTEAESVNDEDLIMIVQDGVNKKAKAKKIKKDFIEVAGIDEYDNTSTYSIGNYCIYNNTLYKCITAIAIAEDFDSTKWIQTSITEEINIKENINNKATSISSQSTNTQYASAKAVYDYIENLNIYSTTEQKIGTWIGKPLYRKVLTFENKTITSNNNSSECVHNVSNLDFGIVREAYYDFNGENVWCTASNVITTGTISYNVGYKVGSSSIYIKYISDISFSASNTRKWLFIIEYTKTTD